METIPLFKYFVRVWTVHITSSHCIHHHWNTINIPKHSQFITMLIPFSQLLALRKYIYTKKTEQIESNQTRNRNTPHKNIYSRNKRREKVQILQIHPSDLDVLFACLLKANDFNQLFEAHPSRPSLVFFLSLFFKWILCFLFCSCFSLWIPVGQCQYTSWNSCQSHAIIHFSYYFEKIIHEGKNYIEKWITATKVLFNERVRLKYRIGQKLNVETANEKTE